MYNKMWKRYRINPPPPSKTSLSSQTETSRAVSEVCRVPHYLIKIAIECYRKNYTRRENKVRFLFVATEAISLPACINNIPLKIVREFARHIKTPDGIELVFAFDANTNTELHKGNVTIQMFAASTLGDEFTAMWCKQHLQKLPYSLYSSKLIIQSMKGRRIIALTFQGNTNYLVGLIGRFL